MKKSVINQFEKTLRGSFSCWVDITIEREDRNEFEVFNIFDRDRTTFYSAPLRKALAIVDAFNIAEGDEVSLFIETKIDEEGYAKPYIEISINKTAK